MLKHGQVRQAGLDNFFKKTETKAQQPEDVVMAELPRPGPEVNLPFVRPASSHDPAADVEMLEVPAAILPESTPQNSNYPQNVEEPHSVPTPEILASITSEPPKVSESKNLIASLPISSVYLTANASCLSL